MKTYLFYIPLIILFVCWSCRMDNEIVPDINYPPFEETPFDELPDSLDMFYYIGSAWKLAGIVDSETNVLKKLVPIDENSYQMFLQPGAIRREKNTVIGFSSSNQLEGNYVIDYKTDTASISYIVTSNNHENADGVLFLSTLNQVRFYSLQDHKLRLYSHDRKTHLLFKYCYGSCKEIRCRDTYILSDSTFVSMRVEPDTVSQYSINRNIIENKTKAELCMGTDFWIYFFEDDNWDPLRLNYCFEAILWCFNPGKPFHATMDLYAIAQKYNSGRKGKYRIVRDVSLSGIGGYLLCAEFEVI